MKFRTTRRAEQDIIEIYVQGVATFGEAQAERYHAELVAVLGLLADTPSLAREYTQFDPPVRMHPYQAHLIIYTAHENGILVVRVLHGRQDWERYL